VKDDPFEDIDIDLSDDVETAPRPKRRTNDRLYAVLGLTLAVGAALFPWYVFFNQESFGIRPMGYASTRDLPEGPSRNVMSVSPLAIPDEKDGSAAPKIFDPITTATTNLGAESVGAPADPGAARQDFPGKPSYRLLHVANGRALIEDKSGMYIVRVGSVLPDNSRLATLEVRDGDWVIITSNGEVIQR